MSNFAKVIDDILVEHPYTQFALRRDNPSTAFPAVVDMAAMGEFGVVPVAPSAPPTINPITETLTEGSPVLVDDVWTQQWTVTARTPPSTVRRKQARMALVLSGTQLADVQLAIDAIEDATQRTLAQIAWEDATHFDRDDPFLVQLATALGLDESDLDGLFLLASTL